MDDQRDRLFAVPRPVEDFDFGRDTAQVFDDMLERSVPFYEEQQRMIAELAADFVAPATVVYDLGCSTCTSFLQIGRALPAGTDVRFVGFDSSAEMLERARSKLEEAAFPWPYELPSPTSTRVWRRRGPRWCCSFSRCSSCGRSIASA